ncbi:unnamed protein product [Prunus armeniaca]|uniref:Uncharacterized protein n=1 Tax=Prunus armeniaca TaxID=36596 RepID=A0A6J5W5I8_PRUAR|nr:unnamed protein product [Prunus armeniaca]
MDITGVGSMEIEKGTFVILTNDGSLTNYKSTRGRAIKENSRGEGGAHVTGERAPTRLSCFLTEAKLRQTHSEAAQSYKTQNKSATVSSSLFAMTC